MATGQLNLMPALILSSLRVVKTPHLAPARRQITHDVLHVLVRGGAPRLRQPAPEESACTCYSFLAMVALLFPGTAANAVHLPLSARTSSASLVAPSVGRVYYLSLFR